MLQANWFDSCGPHRHLVTLYRSDDELVLCHGSQQRRYLLFTLRLRPGYRSTPDMVPLPDGSVLECQDPSLRDWLGGLSHWQRLQQWLTASWRRLLLALLLAAAMLYLIWQLLLPAAVGLAARLIDPQQEARWGQWVLDSMLPEQAGTQQKAQQTKYALQLALARQMVARLRPADSRYQYHVQLYWDDDAGANAMALPGGQLFVTTELLEAGLSVDELFAILAHEVGHVEQRHSLDKMLTLSSLVVVQALLTGDVTFSGSLLPSLLLGAQHSRHNEQQADAFAFAALRRHGLDPCLLGNALSALEAYELGKLPDEAQAYWREHAQRGQLLDSHPPTPQRHRPFGRQCPPPPR